jgi:hypothetical protein
LLQTAESAGYELLITTDKNLPYQQNLRGRKIAIIALGQANWPIVKTHIAEIIEAINAATTGSYMLVPM